MKLSASSRPKEKVCSSEPGAPARREAWAAQPAERTSALPHGESAPGPSCSFPGRMVQTRGHGAGYMCGTQIRMPRQRDPRARAVCGVLGPRPHRCATHVCRFGVRVDAEPRQSCEVCSPHLFPAMVHALSRTEFRMMSWICTMRRVRKPDSPPPHATRRTEA